jgi:hypothetical protein
MSLEPPPLKAPVLGVILERTPLGRWLYLLWEYLRTAQGVPGPTGPTGPQGPQGPIGPAGPGSSVPAHILAITSTQIGFWDAAGAVVSTMTAWAKDFVKSASAAEARQKIGLASTWRRLWAESDKASTYDNVERSVLGATSDQRKMAADTIADGMALRLIATGQFTAVSGTSTLVVKLTIGADGNYLIPYFSLGVPCTALTSMSPYRVVAEVYFRTTGASGSAYVDLSVEFANTGADYVVTKYRYNLGPSSTLDIDTTLDRYIDLWFQVSGGGSSYSTITPAYSYAEICTP